MLPPKYLGNIDPDRTVISNFLRNRHDIHCLSYTFFRNISSKDFEHYGFFISILFCNKEDILLHFKMVKVA